MKTVQRHWEEKMKLIIDDADINSIRKLYEYYPVSGVTTNPSILMKAGRNPFEVS